MGTGDTATESSGDLLYIGSPRLGAEGNQCPPPPFSPAAVCGSVCLFLSQQTRVSRCKVRTEEPWKSIPQPWHAALRAGSPALP